MGRWGLFVRRVLQGGINLTLAAFRVSAVRQTTADLGFLPPFEQNPPALPTRRATCLHVPEVA